MELIGHHGVIVRNVFAQVDRDGLTAAVSLELWDLQRGDRRDEKQQSKNHRLGQIEFHVGVQRDLTDSAPPIEIVFTGGKCHSRCSRGANRAGRAVN